jgi:outer membrane protein OmpA-like peptidoglycan-associated protein
MRILATFILTVAILIVSFSFRPRVSRKSVSTFTIPTLYYDYADSVPNNKINISLLDSGASTMRAYPGLCIEIQGHTDAIEDQKLDTNLSWRRAGIARNMMIAKGISPERLSIRGFRARQTVNHCSSPFISCTEHEHALNRRIQFRVTKVD